MNDLRLIARVAFGLAVLALVAGALALHALRIDREAEAARARTKLANTGPGDAVGHGPRSLAETERTMAWGRPVSLHLRHDGPATVDGKRQ